MGTGSSQVSLCAPHALLEVQTAPRNALLVLLETRGVWIPGILLENQVPTADRGKAAPGKLHWSN